ncbi:MAG: serine/threonine protein kinase [Xanthomonadales bacterium]|nr:serine/threonine protein kinase [Xanthomonadales bacterium]
MLKPPNTAELSFQLGDEIGSEGRNSQVFKARDLQLNAEIVVKKVKKTTFTDIDEYFVEASLLYLSAHPNVVPIHYACHDVDHVYLAMPLYGKGSLKARMASRPLTVREMIVVSTQVLSGIHNIHSKGLIHFDVKPDNILLSERGEAMLSDFGLAKQTSYSGVAGQDRIYGKMVPPEAFQNQDFTRQFDIYQMGLTMHRMSVGDAHFYGEYSGFVRNGTLERNAFKVAVRNGQFPSRNQYPEHIPQKFVNAIRKCLQTDLAQRFTSAIEVVNAVSDIEEALLDWRMEYGTGFRRWVKELDNGKEVNLVLNDDQSSEAFVLSKDGTKRRITEYCTASLGRAEIKKFLREN